MKDFKVSVIIPVYNAEKSLKIAIDSIINQTIGFENIELILVDDMSTDSSREIIEDLSFKYSNIKPIFCKDNSGNPGRGRNIGVKNASADYIIFLDQDDEYLRDGIEILYNIIAKNDSDWVLASHYNKYSQDNLLKIGLNDEEFTFNPHKDKKHYDKIKQYNAPWSKIFKKDFLIANNIRFLEDSLNEDRFFHVNCLNATEKMSVISDVVHVYNILDTSTIHNYSLNQFNSFLKGMKAMNVAIEGSDLSYDLLMGQAMEDLLLIFSNLKKSEKKVAITEIQEFEDELNASADIRNKEMAMLNSYIVENKTFKALSVSSMFSTLYNNKTIKNVYRALNQKRG